MSKSIIDGNLGEIMCNHSGEKVYKTVTDHCNWDSEYTSTTVVEKCDDCGETLQWRFHN